MKRIGTNNTRIQSIIETDITLANSLFTSFSKKNTSLISRLKMINALGIYPAYSIANNNKCSSSSSEVPLFFLLFQMVFYKGTHISGQENHQLEMCSFAILVDNLKCLVV